MGIDIDPERVKVAMEAAKSRNLDDKVTFIESDVLMVNLSEASVILCYLFPTASAALRPKFESELRPGTRIVMESFPVPGWKPVKINETNGRSYYYYVTPVEKTADYNNITTSYSYGYSDEYDYGWGLIHPYYLPY